MSLFDGIFERLSLNSNLSNPNNAGRKVLDNTLGAWLEEYYNTDLYDRIFLSEASEGYLDVIGADFSVPRKLGESDEDYRERIVYESLGHLTVPYLRDIYNVELYVFVDDFNANLNDLTSDNPYISNKYMGVATDEVQSILFKKFVLNEMIAWLVNGVVQL